MVHSESQIHHFFPLCLVLCVSPWRILCLTIGHEKILLFYFRISKHFVFMFTFVRHVFVLQPNLNTIGKTLLSTIITKAVSHYTIFFFLIWNSVVPILGLFYFHINFIINMTISKKNPIQIMIGITLTLYISLCRIAIFILFSNLWIWCFYLFF